MRKRSTKVMSSLIINKKRYLTCGWKQVKFRLSIGEKKIEKGYKI